MITNYSVELARMLVAREITSVELVEAHIAHIKGFPKLICNHQIIKTLIQNIFILPFLPTDGF